METEVAGRAVVVMEKEVGAMVKAEAAGEAAVKEKEVAARAVVVMEEAVMVAGTVARWVAEPEVLMVEGEEGAMAEEEMVGVGVVAAAMAAHLAEVWGLHTEAPRLLHTERMGLRTTRPKSQNTHAFAQGYLWECLSRR